MTIYLPFEANWDLIDILRRIHRCPWAEVVSYVTEEIEVDDDQAIRNFIQSHRDSEQFVYVESATHVAVLCTDKMRGGWIVTDANRYVVKIFHHLVNARSFVLPIQEVWSVTPKAQFWPAMPNYLM
jgi:hypothetical protein